MGWTRAAPGRATACVRVWWLGRRQLENKSVCGRYVKHYHGLRVHLSLVCEDDKAGADGKRPKCSSRVLDFRGFVGTENNI